MVSTPIRSPRIDAHQHFWQLARGDYAWLREDVPALAPIRRDFAPVDLQPMLAAHGVVQTVLVQATDTEAETEHMLTLASAHDFIGGVVGWVDLSRVDAVDTLARWAADPACRKLKGVRPMLQDLPDAQWIDTRTDANAVRALLRHGLRFDALVQPWHLKALLAFVRRWPELPVVIDHAAKPQLARGWAGPDAGWVADWRHGLAELARCPNVHCKLSGLLTEASGSARAGGDAGREALQPVCDLLLEHFGPARLMWGSDWPVLNLAADYAEWVRLSDALLAPLNSHERAAVLHDNAQRFYGLTRGAS